MAIPDRVIEQVRDRADIVEIISGYVTLKKSGSNFKALCPFHHEKTPSFLVSTQKQIFHCFGCGDGGNVFSFLMKMERMSFPEAVEFLADRFGIPVPHDKKESSSASFHPLHDAHALAVRYYKDCLVGAPTTAPVQQYLRKRGISLDLIKRFQLGFAFDQWEGLIHFARAQGVSIDILARAGLVLQREEGGYYDRFRNRLMFPIFDLRGRAIAFGGRVLEEEGTPKYLNSPETEIYRKAHQLYGLWLAKESIKSKNAVVLVEGYFDLISLHQAGIEFVVATCGTALTVEQIRLFKRFTNRVIVVYDGDQAGRMASLRGLDLLLEEGCQVRLMDLPNGKDPDDFIRTEGAALFRERMQQAKDLLEYKLALLLKENNIQDPHQKAAVASQMLATIQKIPSPLLRGEYIRQLAERIHVREENLWSEINRLPATRIHETKELNREPPQKVSLAEKLLIQLIMQRPDLVREIARQLELEDFENLQMRNLMAKIFGEWGDGSNGMDVKGWVTTLKDSEMARFLSSILSSEEEIADPEKNLRDCVRWLKQNQTKRELEKLQQQITATRMDQGERIDQLLAEYQQVLKTHQQQSR